MRDLDLDHAGNQPDCVRADLVFPEDADSATGVIYLQHGFMATGPMYSYTAAHLAEETNSIVVAPTLSSNLFDPSGEWIGGEPMQQSVADLFAGDRTELTASASAAAGQPVTLPSHFVLVGHSPGGMLVTGAAGRMASGGAVDELAGVVLLDAVDTHNDMPEALEALSGATYRPVLLSFIRTVCLGIATALSGTNCRPPGLGSSTKASGWSVDGTSTELQGGKRHPAVRRIPHRGSL